jgi:hypothetical protein
MMITFFTVGCRQQAWVTGGICFCNAELLDRPRSYPGANVYCDKTLGLQGVESEKVVLTVFPWECWVKTPHL